MGHGLVAIPRRLFRNARLSGKLKRIQSRAAKVHEKMEDAIQNLEDLEAQVVELSQRKTGSARYVLTDASNVLARFLNSNLLSLVGNLEDPQSAQL